MQVETENLNTALPPLRILVVEDNPADAGVVRFSLRGAGLGPRTYEVHEARYLSTALNQLKNSHFDVVILELNLPDSFGVATLAKIREAFPNLDVIVVSEETAPEIARTCVRDLKARSYITKDQLNADTLLQAVGATLGEVRTEVTLPAEPPIPRAGGFARPVAPVLVVDDNEINRRVALRMLSSMGLLGVAASSGAEALRLLMKDTFSAVLMDCIMPDLDGFETTRRIRKLEGPAKAVPVVALTAFEPAKDDDPFTSAGMNDLMVKPITLETLRQTLTRWIFSEKKAMENVPMTSTTPARPVLDLDIIASLKELSLEDPENDLLTELVKLFSETTPPLLATMRDAVERGDNHVIQRIAHRLKGGSSNVGAVAMAAVCAEIERKARENPFSEGVQLMTKLESEFAEAVTALHMHLP